MKKVFIYIVVLIVLILVLSGCSDNDVSDVNIFNASNVNISQNYTNLHHIAWVSIEDLIEDEDDLEKLFVEIDEWIENHPNIEIISIQIVNATIEKPGFARRTIPSGAMIVFR